VVFEESPEVFWEKYAEFAVPAELLPFSQGYAVTEAVTPIGSIYAFDRGAPPTPSGHQNVLFAAALESFRVRNTAPGITPLPGGRTLLSGQVRRRLDAVSYLFDAGIPLILNSAEALEDGLGLEIVAAPPLMLFREEA